MSDTKTVEQFNKEVENGLWVKPRQAAKRLNCTPANIYWHIEKGNMPHVRVGEHIYIPEAEIAAREQVND